MRSTPKQLSERLDIPDSEIVSAARGVSNYEVAVRIRTGRNLIICFEDPNWILDMNCLPVTHIEVAEVGSDHIPKYIQELAGHSGSFAALPRYLTIFWCEDEAALVVATQDYAMYREALS